MNRAVSILTVGLFLIVCLVQCNNYKNNDVSHKGGTKYSVLEKGNWVKSSNGEDNYYYEMSIGNIESLINEDNCFISVEAQSSINPKIYLPLPIIINRYNQFNTLVYNGIIKGRMLFSCYGSLETIYRECSAIDSESAETIRVRIRIENHTP